MPVAAYAGFVVLVGAGLFAWDRAYEARQQALFTPLDRQVLEALREADIDNLRPVEALNLLAELKKQVL